MHPEAAYWALLTDDTNPAVAGLRATWLSSGKRSLREIFEGDPQTLALPADAVALLLALRRQVPQARRIVDRLGQAGVEMATRWERRYPKPALDLLGDSAPLVLWHLGPLDLALRHPVAVLGSRDAPPEARDFARAIARALAEHGRLVLTGVSRAVERDALDAALQSGGSAIVVLGQGLARALPDLRRLQPRVQEGTLLVLGSLHPDAAWQPGREDARNDLAATLAERMVVVHLGEDGGARSAARAALHYGRPLYLRDTPDEELLAQGARQLPWPASSEALIAAVLETPPLPSEPGDAGLNQEEALDVAAPRTRSRIRSARPSQQEKPAESTEPVEAGGDDLEDAVLRYLQHTRRKITGKGRLLQAFPVGEAVLDRALISLIARRRIVQHAQRTGTGYALAPAGAATPSAPLFQMSLFGQDE